MNTSKKTYAFIVLFTSLLLIYTGCKKTKTETSQPVEVTAPAVTTSDITVFTQTTATCGGNVTEDGGATVTTRGICWDINPNPTITGSMLASGGGKGIFNVQLTGLILGQKYYVRAYATNSKGTTYGAEKNFTTDATLAVGLPHEGGIIFYLDSTKQHGLVCADADQGTIVKWGCSSIKISGALGTGIGKGAINTAAIMAACNEYYSGADICTRLVLNGYDDWFLPSKDELTLMYFNLKAKGIGNLGNTVYWSSTQYAAGDGYAETVRFSDGGSQGMGKDGQAPIRAARAF